MVYTPVSDTVLIFGQSLWRSKISKFQTNWFEIVENTSDSKLISDSGPTADENQTHKNTANTSNFKRLRDDFCVENFVVCKFNS